MRGVKSKPVLGGQFYTVGDSGTVKIIASIEDPIVIRKILAHLDQKASMQPAACLPESRAPPPTGLIV